ncbi:Crp/Fnr family transcriptional regulator [Spirosoma arcticum]
MATLPEPFDYLADVLPVAPAELALLREFFTPLTVPRHTILLKQGQPCRNLWFVQRGLLRSYYTTERDEVTCWAALPDQFMTSLAAFLNQTPSPENIQALEPSQLMVLTHRHWQQLNEQPTFRERWSRSVESRYADLELRMGSLRAMQAPERYAFMAEQYPELLRRLPLKYVASILGIEPRHLSRIRAGR